jgi:hypothetical protein
MEMANQKRKSKPFPLLDELVKKVKAMTSQLRAESEDVAHRAHNLDQKAHQVHMKAHDVEQAERKKTIQ